MLAIVAVAVGGTLVLAGGANREVGAARAASVTAEPALLGFDFRAQRRPLHSGANYPHGRGTLAELDPLTLRPVSRRVNVRGFVFGWERSPDGKRVALSTSERGRIQLIDMAGMRTLRTFRLPVQEPISFMRWVAPDRLLVVTFYGRATAWELDADGAVRERHALGGRVMAAERLPDGLAVLLAPEKGTGRARLALVRAGDPPRTVELPGVEAGFPARPPGHQEVPSDAPPDLLPGLAVGDGAAWVVNPGAFRVARVDLASGSVTTHEVGVTARASKGGPIIERHARWLGDGLLAVSGLDSLDPLRPFGLRVVDTTTWRARVINPDARAFDFGAGTLLYSSENAKGRRTKLTGYAPDGRRRFTFRPRFGLGGVDVAGDYAYVRNGGTRNKDRRMHVIDLPTGREAAKLPLPRRPAANPLSASQLILLTHR